jgi:hypothetical protein
MSKSGCGGYSSSSRCSRPVHRVHIGEDRRAVVRLSDVSLPLLLLAILLPVAACVGVILLALRPRDDELVVVASGFVVVRE